MFQEPYDAYLGRFCRHIGPVAISTFLLLRFLPLIRYGRGIIGELMHSNLDRSMHNDALHFWTVFAANFSEFLLFSMVYWRTLLTIQNDRKRESSLAVSSICCSATTLSALAAIVTGRKLPRVRRLLLEVSDTRSSR